MELQSLVGVDTRGKSINVRDILDRLSYIPIGRTLSLYAGSETLVILVVIGPRLTRMQIKERLFSMVDGCLKKTFSRFCKDRSGITGLETAIVLIAFVVVAAVFAFTVLTTGLFTSEKAKETALAGVATTSSSMTIKGNIIARATTGANPTVEVVRVKVATATGVERVLFDPEQILVTYQDENNVEQLAYPGGATGVITTAATVTACKNRTTHTWCYARDGADLLLDPGEVNELYIFVDDLATKLGANKQFTIEIIPQDGAVLKFERRTPLSLSPVMNLD